MCGSSIGTGQAEGAQHQITKVASGRVRRARTVSARTTLSSDRDPEFTSYENAHIKLTLFLILGPGNSMPSIQLINIVFHIYSSTSRVIMLVCTT